MDYKPFLLAGAILISGVIWPNQGQPTQAGSEPEVFNVEVPSQEVMAGDVAGDSVCVDGSCSVLQRGTVRSGVVRSSGPVRRRIFNGRIIRRLLGR